jgi:hypothetical protein
VQIFTVSDHRLIPVLFVALLAILPSSAIAEEDASPVGKPLAAKWEYSTDGGKTFVPGAPMIPPSRVPDEKNQVAARAVFTIDDPTAIGLLKLMTHGVEGGLALSDARSVDRYNVGSRPNLTNTRLKLNAAATTAGHVPYTLYRYLSIDPALLRKGENKLTVSGLFWFSARDQTPLPGSLRLETLPTDVATLDRHPVLGQVDGESFSLSARSVIPVEFSVTAQSLDPPGEPKTHPLGRRRLLKTKVPLPKGTKKFRYTVNVSAAEKTKKYGPYNVVVPTDGQGFRFMVAGGTWIYGKHPESLKKFFTRVRHEKPQLYIHTGNYQNCNAWDWMWNHDFLRHGRTVLAETPLLPMCGCNEMLSPLAFSQTFYFPPDDKDYGHWSYAVGPVRFVAIEAFSQSQTADPAAAAKWLDEVLSVAKEKYVIVLNSHVGQCGRAGRRFRPGVAHVEKHIDPLLVKHKVTLTIGGVYPIYQRLEPPATKGVPTIVAGRSGGLGAQNRLVSDALKLPHTKAAFGVGHYCLFEVTKDKLIMRTVDLDGKQIDRREYQPRRR